MSENDIYNCPLCGRVFAPENGLTADEHLAKGIIAAFKEMQVKEESGEHIGKPLPCPRCGYIRKDENGNPLSRHEDILICMNCAIEETVIEASGNNPLPITQWRIISDLLKALNG